MRYAFADRIKNFKSSAVREILSVIQQGNVISFAGGLPYEDFFPIDEVKSAYEKVFAAGKGTLQYGMTEGYLPLRSILSESMVRKGIPAHEDNILLTTGSQQAIDLFTRVMISPGDVILTENPTYLAAIQVFQSFEAEVVPVEGDRNGMNPDDLEKKIKQLRPKFIYVVPTFSNPEGKVWSQERRQMLLQLAQKYHVVIFEDDPYGEIQFDREESYVPIAAMDQEKAHVVYTSTFSKTVVPALRTGWVTGPYQVIRMMSQAKQAADLHSSSLDQQALYYLVRDFDLDKHVTMLCKEYYHRMTIMQDYLKGLESSSISWIEPKGGMFLWLKIDEQIDTTGLLMEAVKKGVAFVPGAPFYIGQPELNTLRLNFTHASPERIKLGMDRFTEVLNVWHEHKETPMIL
jgi:2-aminoadipate transaminase